MTKKIISSLFVALIASVSFSAQALVVDYSGSVLDATGALASLVPVGTTVFGGIDYDDAAVVAGLAGADDILSIDVSVGGFCFTTGLDNLGCGGFGAVVPVDSIDGAGVTFAGSLPTGGFLDITTFSPTFTIFIPISFDLTAGTFEATSPLGGVTGTFGPAPVPVPAAVWLFGSALLGMMGIRRRG